MNLDDESRARLRALGRAQQVELDDAARGRIARRVAAEGPRAMRRARRQRSATIAAGAVAALGFAAFLAVDGRAPLPEVRRPSAPAQVAAAPAVAPRGCETRGVIAPHWSAGAADAARIDLGAVGTVAVHAGTSMWLDAADPCRIALRLEQGRVDVHAADLAGGALRVQTASGDVLVHGTRFSVQHAAGALTVEVDEGRVAVRRRDGTLIAMLARDQRLRVSQEGAAAIEVLDADARAAIRAAFDQPAPESDGAAEPSAPRAGKPGRESTAALALRMVAEADALWRRGERDAARERYRKAGAQSGATAEAAWLALARRELSANEPAAASAAIAAYEARFPAGELASEAAGIAYRVALQQGDLRLARRRAETLQQRYPHTPQAEAAARWLRAHPAQGPR